MSKKIPYQQMVFINIHVTNLDASIEFYKKLGFVHNAQFTDPTTAMVCLPYLPEDHDRLADVPSPVAAINVMLLLRDRFETFLPKGRTTADPRSNIQALLCLSSRTREELDAFCDTVEKAGGKTDVKEKQDHGWMYSRTWEDLDGHVWALAWMDEKNFECPEAEKEGKKEQV